MSRRGLAGRNSGGRRPPACVAIPLARLRHPRATLLAATALQVGALTVVLLVPPARAQSVAPGILPSGGQVIGGTATIARSGKTLSIDQSTTNAAINWQSFSIGSQAAVGFHVPTPQSTTINRVIGPDPSVIAGRLTSNGRVVIANQSGIVFTGGAQVDVNALVASAPGITAANARAGKLIFDQPARPGASVVNNGNITIRQAGLAALVGPTVANNGVISARLGHVVLQGAAAATLDFYGDGLLSFDVTKQVTHTPSGATALVTNTGTIVAEGGTVTLSAAAIDGLVTNLVEAGGRIATPSVSARTGSIVIDGTGGSVTVVGQLAAQGTAPGTIGGTIAVNATGAVTVASGARLDASGDAGGGTVAVGTNAARAKGGPTVKAPAAASVAVAQGATLAADAWTKGDGGHVTVLALGDTDFAGHVEARGGEAGGNGGTLEISGAHLQLSGGIDASAPNGTIGSLLLDPGNLKIVTGGGDTVTNGTTYTSNSTTSLDPGSIESIAADVTLSADGHISIESSLNVTHGLTLFAGSSIVVDQPITSTAGIELGAGQTSLGGSGNGGITVNAAITSTGVSAGADGIVLSAGSNGIALNANLNAPVVDLSAAGNGVTQATTASITATTLQSSNSITGDLLLIGTNTIASVGAVAMKSGRFELVDAAPLTLDGLVAIQGSESAGLLIGGLVEGTGSIAAGAGLISIAAFPTADVLAIGGSGAGTVSLDPTALGSITAGELMLTGNGVNVAATASLAAIPTVDIEAGTGTITFSGGTLHAASLVADAAAITQSGGTLDATTLATGTAGLGGVTLDGATNDIATISALGSLTGDLRIMDGTALTLAGSNQATNVVLADSATGTAITLGGTLQATSLDLSASAGSVAAQSSATIAAGTLASASGISGSLDLSASSNTIGTLGAVTATGGLQLVDTTLVSVAGVVSVGSGNTLSIADDGLGLAVGGSLSAPSGVVELGPVASGRTVLLGTTGTAGTIAPGDLSAITAGTLRLGKTVLESNEAGTIHSGGTVSALNIGTLELDASGGVTLANPVTLSASGVLAGTMAHLAVTGAGNVIPNLGSVNAGSGSITVDDGVALSVTGPVTGGVVVLSDSATGTAITVGGTLAGATSVELDASAGSVSELVAGTITTPLLTSATLAQGITLDGTANAITTLGTLQATAGNVLVTDGAALTLAAGSSVGAAAGNVVLTDGTTGAAITLSGGTVSASGTLDLSAANGSVSQTGGTLMAGTLASGAGVGGSLDLTGSHNTIATLGALSAGTLALDDTSSLSVAGVVQASAMSLQAAGITLATTGSLLATGAAVLNPLGAGVSETGAGLISAGTLSLPSATGAVTLAGNNTIATLGSVTATGATVDISVGSGTLNVAGPVVAANATLADTESGQLLTVSGSVSATGTLDLASAGAIDASGGTIVASTLIGNATGNAALTGSNTIATLGGFAATGGLQLVDTTLVSVAGVVSVGSGNTLSIADDGLGLAVGGSLSAPSGVVELGPVSSGGTVLLGATGAAGEIAPGSLSAITAGTLRLGKTVLESNEATTILSGGVVSALNVGTLELDASGGVTLANPVTLSPTGVLAGTMASLAVTGSGNVIPNLGNVNAGTGSITVDDGVALSVTGPVTGGVVVLSDAATGTAIIVGGTLAGTTSVELDASAGSVSESATGTITTPLLTSATLAQGITLVGDNTIATLGSVTATGSTVDISVSSGTLNVAGPVVAANATLADTASGQLLTVSGSVNATGTLDLASAGAIDESGGTIVAGTLIGNATGNVALTGSNTIAALGGFTATGGLQLVDTTLVSVVGVVSVGSGNTLSIADDGLGLAVGGSLLAPSGVVELGPVSSGGTVLLGATGVAGEIAPGSLSAITAGTLRLGKTVLESNEAGTILSGGVVSALNVGTLELDASGGVTLANPVTLSPTGVLAGTMASLAVTGAGNVIPNLGSVNAGTGSITVDDGVALSVPGTVTGGVVTLFPTTLTVSGSIAATSQLNLLASPGGITLTGTLSSPTGTVDLTTGGGITQNGGVIIAGTLVSAFGAGGPVALGSGQNTIATLGGFSAPGQNISITDSTALVVSGTVAGATVTLDAPTLAVNGSIAGTSLIRLDGGAGGIALAGTLSSPAGMLDLGAASGSVTQMGGVITVGTLVSSAGVGGSLDLTGGSNTIATLGALSAGTLALDDTSSLSVADVVQASAMSLQAAGITLATTGSLLATGAAVLNPLGAGVSETGAGLISAGTLSLPSATGAVTLAGNNTIATLGSVTATGATVDISVGSGTLNVVGPVVAANATLADTASGQALTVSGSVNATGTLDLASAGAIDASGGTIVAGTLIGNATGNVALTGSNAIATLGGFTATPGAFALTDQRSLAIAGPVAATTVTLDAPTLSVTGSVAGTSLVSLDAGAGGLGLSGTVSSPSGVVDISSAGAVTQTAGAILAGTLTSALGLGGSVDLGSTFNAIGVLGQFSAPGQVVVLADGTALTVAGPVSASAVTLSAPSLSVTGSLSGTSLVSLDAGSGGLGLSGTVSSPSGVVDISSAGAVTQSAGAILAGTLASGSGLGGSVDLGSTLNAIGVLGPFSAPGQNVALRDGSALVVSGPVSAATIDLTDEASGTALTVTGSVVASGLLGLSTPNGTASLGGMVNAAVLGVAGQAVTQSGGTVVAGTLESTGSLGLLTLTTTTIGVVGPLTATSAVALTDASLVTITAVNAPTVSISDPAGIIVAGPLEGANGVTLASSGGSVDVTGSLTVGTGTLDVTASGGFVEGAGAVLRTPVLTSTGGIGGTGVQLAAGRNTVATLGPLVASGGITIADQVPLTQTGLLEATSGNISLSDAASSGPALSLDGTIMAAGIVLASTAPGITGNAIDQPVSGGVLEGLGGAGTSLTVNAASGNVAILGSGNQIANLAGQAAGAITVNDAAPLAVTGSLVASGITLDVAAAGGLTLAGSVDAGPGGTLDVSSPGGVTQTAGTIRAGVVRSAAGVGSLRIAVAGDSIGVVGSLASAGPVDLASAIALDAMGPVSGSAVTLSAPSLSVTGTLAGTSLVSLEAGSGGLGLSGTVSSPSGVVDISSAGAVTQSGGAILAGTLASGSGLGGSVDLGSTLNAIGVLGPFSAPGQNVALTDGAAVTVNGPVTATNLRLTDEASGTALTVAGSVTAAGTLALATPSGFVSLGGSVAASVLDVSGVSVGQTGGTVKAAVLENTGSLGSLTLTSSTIGVVGPLTATGAVALTDASLVTLAAMSAPTVSVIDPAGIIVAGPLDGANGVTLASSGGSINLTGTLTVGGFGVLDVTAAGGFGESAGAVLSAPVLTSAGGIGGTGVQLAAGRNTIRVLEPLVAAGGITIADQVPLTQTGLLEATSGNVSLSDAASSGPALSLNGTIMASGIVLASMAPGITGDAIAVNGALVGLGGAGTSLTVNAASGNVAILGNSNQIANLAGQAAGGITVNDAAALAVTGSLTAGGTIALAAPVIAVDAPLTSSVEALLTAGNGLAGANQPAITIASAIDTPILALTSRNPGLTTAVLETGGAVTTGTLTATIASGATDLGQMANRISGIGAFTAPGQMLVIGNSAPMTISGPVSVGNFTLNTTQPVSVVGNLDVSNTWSIASTSDIDHTSGLLRVGTITGRAGQNAIFGSGDLVGTLGPFAMADSTLQLDNAQALVLDGPIVADYLAITAMGTVTIRGNIQTVGLPIADQTGTAPSNPGSYIGANGADAAILQVGQTMITTSNPNLGNPTVRFELPPTGGGLINFANLVAPQLNLILGLEGGGNATGTIAVGSLTVIEGTGTAKLNGTVATFAGSIAAQNSNILPRPNGNYTLNNCPLKSVSCIVLPIALVIPANPLDELLVSVAPPENDDLDILLPGIARKDY